MALIKPSQPRVLIVDDDALSRTIVARKLAALASIIEAGDGAEAIAHLQAHDVHLVVVDLDMPGINGLDLIKYMRAHPALRNIPIIVLTANEIDGLRSSYTAGVTSALRKPLDWRAFGEHVRHVLDLAFRASHLALRDALTGLANRSLFEDRLRQALASAGPSAPVAVHLLDLDRFKHVNDTLGHAAGDELLVEVALRLSEVARESPCIARLGGDEFAILQVLPATSPAEAAEALGRAVVEALSRAYTLSSGEARIGASVGIDIANSPATAFEALLRNADGALYAAKKAGRAMVRVHGRCDAESAQTPIAPCGAPAFDIVCQPVFSIAAGTVIACEVRLSREHAGQLSPTAVKLRNLHLLDQALALAARWTPAIAVVIRLDPQPFDETELARLLAARLAQARIKPSQITIEISERDFTPAVLERNDWRFMSNLGVKISVCDLGRGPIPIDVIAAPWISKCKLDGALVQDLPTRESERRKARAVVGIAAGLRLRVGAADVATPEQFAAAAEVGCTEAQGAGCADWLKPDAFAHWLEARRARSAI